MQGDAGLSKSELGWKLRVSAVALGVAGVKELAARFRSVNPRSHFQPERAQKWFQGRALPRSRELYDDWAKVLGIGRSGAWLEAATLDAFAREVSSICDLAPDVLLERAGAPVSPATAPRTSAGGALSFLSGTYACYSAAWCPYYRGRIIRGAMELTCRSDAPAAVSAEYTEAFLGETVHFRGEMFAVGRALYCDLRKAGDGMPLFGSFILPGPPASVLCGILSGSTVLGPDPEPSATRMLVVRVPTSACESNRYLEDGETIAADLAALGIAVPEPAQAALQDFLGAKTTDLLQKIPIAEHARITTVFDASYLQGRNRTDLGRAA